MYLISEKSDIRIPVTKPREEESLLPVSFCVGQAHAEAEFLFKVRCYLRAPLPSCFLSDCLPMGNVCHSGVYQSSVAKHAADLIFAEQCHFTIKIEIQLNIKKRF
ncbi:hypothetical protein NPIL_414581 [Nephila pilipes]|uniref:Uncharacterized protein n=1 Tax=Nephila pilipes TaxID=299642 RepID=A0A8X6TJW9_NEPPI|nr:hypothetical protein NPIL_414581 [Nephila pilipes]